ncbi:MAG: hypothetical protein AB7O47_04795 [Flavobacteriales bacterium]
MKFRCIPSNRNGYFMVFDGGQTIRVNPIKHYYDHFVRMTVNIRWEMLKYKIQYSLKLNEILLNEGKDFANEMIEKYTSIELPEGLKKLLEHPKKKEQIKMLKGITLEEDMLPAFFIQAFEIHGYLYSIYRFEHDIAGIENEVLPRILVVNNNKVEKYGATTLSDGKLKDVLNQRNVIVANFLENDKGWHCFFFTFKSLKGLESHNDGQPHYHYISDKWGIPREKVLEELSKKNYSLPSLPHINFIRGEDD